MARKKSIATTKRMESELRKLGRNLDRLAVRTKEASDAARLRYARELKVLREKRAQAKQVLAKLNRQSTAAGAPLKAGILKAWASLSAAASEARKRFRETA